MQKIVTTSGAKSFKWFFDTWFCSTFQCRNMKRFGQKKMDKKLGKKWTYLVIGTKMVQIGTKMFQNWHKNDLKVRQKNLFHVWALDCHRTALYFIFLFPWYIARRPRTPKSAGFSKILQKNLSHRVSRDILYFFHKK